MISTFISAADLLHLLQAPALDDRPIVIDTRFSLAAPQRGRRDYLAGHIHTARYAHLDADLSGRVIPGVTGRHPLPDPARLAARFGAWGISNDTQVVAYDDDNGGIAARLWWLLRWLGHEAAAVLDGGWRAWTAAGGPASTEVPEPAPTVFRARLDPDLLLDRAAIMAMRIDRRASVVDSRTADRYAGQNETIDPVAGHIPGASNLPYPDTTHPDGTSLDPAALRRLFRERLGDFDPASLAFYCGSGVTAARNVLALEHAGLPGSKLYAGSWSEWIAHSDEVEKGSQTQTG